jgi:4-hydroxythreonine-4-phosphate dehydrogenase
MSSPLDERPVIGITIGDAAGIGPEISLKAISDPGVTSFCRCVLIGDQATLARESARIGLHQRFAEFRGDISSGEVEVHDLANLPERFAIGMDAAETGRASAENILAGVELWRRGSIDAICTAPISKKAISLAGYDFPGHTEFLAELTGTQEFRMSFFAGELRVLLLSTHLSLVDAIGLISTDSLIEIIRFASRELSKLLGRPVSVAVAGLNPHASEDGLFGNEEADVIRPAVDQCRDEFGINVSGPYSPDTIFLRGYKGEFDAVIALYHDQATIAVKSLSFGSGVNVTLGLPLVRTSVDHGTAFDIAGRRAADASSMIGAVKLAGELVRDSRSRREV